MNNRPIIQTLSLAGLLFIQPLIAAETLVTLYNVNAQGTDTQVGTVSIVETPYGLLFQPSLTGLPNGYHGFHIHEKPNCGPSEKEGNMIPAGAAGGHFDPDNSGVHKGPYGEGHRGDLPALVVNAQGVADYPVLAPRLKRVKEITGHALMVHVGGDNYADSPAPLGGGGARMLCGVIR
ncbi:superoxide dismutase family protein [Kistimonas asteriae]|uniref:superoxide dismutase family protein n=1 Tax=Kistimonas asteriae TaxID=517724 RepID=UPI001BA6CAAB|nr:superoxide dismutase family protein [Kistimonas asteriae]